MKYLIKFCFIFFCLIALGCVFLPSAQAAPTCQEKYLDNFGQCAPGCATGEVSDTDPALCNNIGVCCHKQASTSGTASNLELQVPLFDYTLVADLPTYIATIYKYALIIIVPLAIFMIIVGGIRWISAAGNDSQIKKARSVIFSSIIGLLISLFSYIFFSLIGITTIKLPGIQTIEPMPIPIIDFEYDTADNPSMPVGNAGAPPVAGTMPRIFQCDYRSVRFNCASKNVCSSGCGTVSATMVLRYYGKNISVPQAVQFMGSGGYIGCGVIGTSPSGFGAIAKANGLNYQTVSVDFNTIKNYVAGGKPIIANVGARSGCKYTKAGHFIVLAGWDAPNNRFIINDPGGRTTNRFNGTWDELVKNCVFKGAYYIGK